MLKKFSSSLEKNVSKLFSIFFYVLAVSILSPINAEAIMYNPGDTLEPACSPTSPECGVISVNLGNTDLTLSGPRSLVLDGNIFTIDGLVDTIFDSSGGLTIGGNFITPRGSNYTVTGIQNDVDLGPGSVINYTGSGAASFSGFSGGVDGRQIRLVNNSNSTFTLTHEDNGSMASNRILISSGLPIVISPNGSITILYDSSISRWRLVQIPASSTIIGTFAFLQNGNSYGTTAVLGTNDANPLVLRTNGNSALSLDVSGNGTLSGDLTISGDDLFMSTNTNGAMLVANGTNFNPVVMSGDATIDGNGVISLNYSGGQSADTSTKGFLTAADWNIFNNKQNSLGFTPEDSSNKSTNVLLGTSDILFPTQNAVKTYVDNKDLGLVWHDPVEIINVIADTSTPVVAPANLDVYIINTGGNIGDWAAFDEGDMIQYQTDHWEFIKALTVGDEFGVAFKSNTIPSGDMTGYKDYLVKITGGVPGAFIYSFESPDNNDAVFVQNPNAYYHDVSFTYSSHINGWVQLSAAVNFSFGNGLGVVGTDVSLGDLTSDWNQTGAFNINTVGDINLNGGDLNTTSLVASLFNTNATTLNIGGSANTINLGASGAVLSGVGALNIRSGATTNLVIDSGTTGSLDLGTGNNAKTINLGTGNSGNSINIGTNNTVADNISIGSSLDSFSLVSSGLNVNSSGALTGVASINTVTHTSGAITFSGSGSISSNGTDAISIDSGTTGNVNLGTGNNAKTISIGTGTSGKIINIATNVAVDTLNIGSTSDNLTINSSAFNVNSSGVITGVSSIDTIGFSATGLSFAGAGNITSATSSALSLDSGTTGAINIGTGANPKIITLGNVTGATAVNINSGTGNANFTIGPTSSSGRVQIGNSATATPDLLVLDNGTADPVGVNGGMYYNTTVSKFRCYENGAWKNCDAVGSDLQHVASYDNNESFTNVPTGGGQTTLGNVSVTPNTTTGDVYVTGFAEVRSSNNTDQPFNLVIETTNNCTGTTVGNASVTYTITTNTSTTTHLGNVRVSGIAVDPGASSQSYSLCAAITSGGGDTDVMNWGLEATVIDTGADLAEIYTTNDSSIEPGDVVSFDPSLRTGMKKSEIAYSAEILGVVTTHPGLVIGGVEKEGVNALPVALTGRVPVKVNTEGGEIKVGDYLTSSSVAGEAMRATKSGPVIGQALTGYDGEGVGTVLVFVKNTYFEGVGENFLSKDDIGVFAQTLNNSYLENVVDYISEKVVSGFRVAKEIFAQRMTAILGVFEKVQTNYIEMKDSATGEIYCIQIVNGDWEKTKGGCNQGQQETIEENGEENTTDQGDVPLGGDDLGSESNGESVSIPESAREETDPPVAEEVLIEDVENEVTQEVLPETPEEEINQVAD